MFSLKKLNEEQLSICHNTISSNAFYMIVGDALSTGKKLSLVRMADGEWELMKNTFIYDKDDFVIPPKGHDESWLIRQGCYGIRNYLISERMKYAANNCTYFGASITGIDRENYNVYDLFNKRDKYVDNFFVNVWSEEMKINLFKKAGHVLFINAKTEMADCMQIRAKWGLGVKVTFLKLTKWEEADSVIEKSAEINAPLTLFSAGPASKIIGPKIVEVGQIPKVALDIGAAAQYWLLSSLKDTVHKGWDETNIHLKEQYDKQP